MRLLHRPGLFLIGLISFGLGIAHGQSAKVKKTPSTIAGRITIDSKGMPGVEVMLKPDAGGLIVFGVEQAPAQSAATDADGRYRLTNVLPGRYRVSAFAPAYVIEGESNPFLPGVTVNVGEGENVETLDFSLTRGGVITGKVIDEDGQPIIGEPVTAYKLGIDGKRQPDSLLNRMSVRWETDDRGVYRIFGLEPGRYLIVSGSSGMGSAPRIGGAGGGRYRRTFYPEAAEEAQAKVIEVKRGEEIADIDIKVTAPAKGYIATGHVIDADTGKPLPGVTINCSATRSDENSSGVQIAITNSLGQFRVEGLIPNSYRAFVVNTQGSDPLGDQVTFDVVNSDVSGLEIRMRQGATISGTAVVEGSNDPDLRAKLAQVKVIAQGSSNPVMIRMSPGGSGMIGQDGNFKLSNVKPGKTRINMSLGGPKGFSLTRVERNGVEVREFDVGAGDRITGVRLIFTYSTNVITGRVEIKGGVLPPGVRLMVRAIRKGDVAIDLPAAAIEVDGRGQFIIEGLPQGIFRLTLALASSGLPENSFKLPPVEQMVTVAGEGRQEVTLIVDLTPKEGSK